MNRAFVKAMALTAAMAAAAPAGGAPAARELKPPFEEIGFDQRLGETLPLDLEFRDESGRPVRLREYFDGRPVILNLAYYRCPMLCTLVMNGIASSAGALNFALGRDYTIVTVSIDPRETPQLAAAKKATYLKEYDHLGPGQGWHFLTGDAASIKPLADSAGFRYMYDAEKDQYAHASGVVVVTPEGRIAQYFFGIEYAPRDLRLALVSASAGRIGTVADRLMLLCYEYDPATGHYGATAYTLMRAGGVVTLFALAGFIIVMLRRDALRARRRAA